MYLYKYGNKSSVHKNGKGSNHVWHVLTIEGLCSVIQSDRSVSTQMKRFINSVVKWGKKNQNRGIVIGKCVHTY